MSHKKWQSEYQNLIIQRPGESELLCPVCLEPVSRYGLTAGDVYPQHCRSTALVVPECKRCNNELGATVDVDLDTTAALVKHAFGELPAEEAAKLFGRRVQIQSDGQRLHTLGSSVQNNTAAVDFGFHGLAPWCETLPGGRFKLNMTLQFGNSSNIAAALLHSALLRLFHAFGYEYVLDASVAPIRTALADAAESRGNRPAIISRFTALWETCRTFLTLPKDYDRISIIRAEDDTPLAFACFVRYVKNVGGLAMLPGLGVDAQAPYARVLASLRGSVAIESIPLYGDRDSRLRNRANPESCKQIWNRKPCTDRIVRDFPIGRPDINITLDNLYKLAQVQMDISMRQFPKRARGTAS